MPAQLRVDPDRLRRAAQAQADVGDFICGLGAGESLNNAGTGVSGLLSAGACQFAGSIIESSLGTVHDELTAHSANLVTAADHYHRTDADLGRRLRKFTS